MSAHVESVAIPQVDWVARFREGFRAFTAAGFQIVPVWDAEQRKARPADQLIIDPGRAFGTGTHESTRLCLATLVQIRADRPLGRTADLGTGTGILALAARRLGACPVVATDLDPDAVASAVHHAELNDTPLAVVRGNGARPLAAGVFDLVMANLSTPLLLARHHEIVPLLAPEGRLILAGLLAEDVSLVREAYSDVGPIEQRVEGEWAALLAVRR